MSDLIQHLNDTNFSEVVEKNSAPILVDFWADWCMPCRALAPILDELATELNGKVRFAKVNTEESSEIPAKFRIRGIPTLILFNNGKKVDELVGYHPKEKIKNFLSGVAK